jgi:predicted Rdx family selenoprotein
MVSPDHKVVIEYCVPGDLLNGAVRVAAEVTDGWAPILETVELRAGVKGVFKVSLDGRLLFDKAAAGRMPSPGEMADEMTKHLGPRLKWRKSH